MEQTVEQSERSQDAKKSLAIALCYAHVLFFVDCLWLNQGGISAFVGLYVLLSVPFAALAKPFSGRRKIRFAQLGIYTATVVLVFGANKVLNDIAYMRGGQLVIAIDAYQEQTGTFPESLQQLVPDFLEEVPTAKPILGFNEFMYTTSGENPLLSFQVMPPFHRAVYDFENREWTLVD